MNGQISASVSTIIKSILARTGPQTQHKLFAMAHESFPNEFSGITRHKFKSIYIRNLKEFKQIVIKPCRDAEIIEKLAVDPDTRVRTGQKEAWMVAIPDNLATKYISGEVDLNTSHSKIVSTIEDERAKSKEFWQGETNQPHDWKAILEKAGHKTSL
ncbi:hypothetical protein IWW50_003193 [Coemansia erecta]|nr:hypothetical protein GGF43_005116 [Coemansia sp. RSA 2618]KAJ2824726.1 hypothetical protein IWW50_003193 [Coemansia erecta]